MRMSMQHLSSSKGNKFFSLFLFQDFFFFLISYQHVILCFFWFLGSNSEK